MHNRFSTVLAERFGLAKDRFPETEREIHQAEDALAKEMSRMSLVEQERILFDVHGIETTTPGDAASVGCSGESVASCDPESHLEDYLRRFDEEVRRVSTVDRTAYERAVYLDEDYVRGMRTTFLRASNFDALAAAEGMAKYFTHKRELFGDGILARDVRLSDLTDYELEHLESGYLQLLPSRDASGRAVIFMAPGYQPVPTPTCEEEGKVDEDAAFKSLVRVRFASLRRVAFCAWALSRGGADISPTCPPALSSSLSVDRFEPSGIFTRRSCRTRRPKRRESCSSSTTSASTTGTWICPSSKRCSSATRAVP